MSQFPQFVCPRDRNSLLSGDDDLTCTSCRTRYPIRRGIPILIDDSTSVFSTADYLENAGYEGASYGRASDRVSGVRAAYRRLAASLSDHAVAFGGFSAQDAVAHITLHQPTARILVVGAGDARFAGDGFVYTDVAFSSGITCIMDAHQIPFPDQSFDAVLAVAVLEHVADPFECAKEFWRVLKPNGFVYAATPFLQPVHMGAHDFVRFTHLGHRRLFRWFAELQSGPALGPAASAAYVFQHLLLSLSDRASWRRAARLAGLLLSVPIRYLDILYRGKRGALSAAAGFYFFGRKAEEGITDRALIKLYRGL